MKAKLFLSVIALCFAITASCAADKQHRILIRDENGKLLGTSHYIWLTRSRVAVPVQVYARFGLVIIDTGNKREVYVAEPGTDGSIGFTVKERRIYYPAGGEYSESYNYSLAQRRHGHFYVAAHMVQKNYTDWFISKWNNRTSTLTLQKIRAR